MVICDVIQQIVIIMFILFLKCTFPLHHILDCGNASVHTGKVHPKYVVLCWVLATILEYYIRPPVTVVTIYASSLLFLCILLYVVVQLEKWQPVLQAYQVKILVKYCF